MNAHQLERIIVVPRNGYANRLQAWASAAILAQGLEVPLHMVWEAERIAPAPAAQLFSLDRMGTDLMDPAELTESLGGSHRDLPRYLSVDERRRLIILAGHDRGEQVLMPALMETLARVREPMRLLIIAGGKFHAPGQSAFIERRGTFYRALPWSETIITRVAQASASRSDYLGLHIRGTDRAHDAPTDRSIRTALAKAVAASEVTSLFIAADSDRARREWASSARRMHLDPWTSGDVAYDRTSPDSGIDALVDWILLGRAVGGVGSSSSSFAEEAAVASGRPHDWHSLSASSTRRRFREFTRVATDVMSYPKRRWFTPA